MKLIFSKILMTAAVLVWTSFISACGGGGSSGLLFPESSMTPTSPASSAAPPAADPPATVVTPRDPPPSDPPVKKTKIATLAPAGTNHDLNAQRYIDHYKIPDGEILYYEDFLKAAEDMKKGDVDLVFITPAHTQYKALLQANAGKIFKIDCFRGRTHEMALLSRATITNPRSVAYFATTAVYFDVNTFETRVTVGSNIEAGRRLVAGEFDSAFTFTSFVTENPGQFRIDKLIGESNVMWEMYSSKPATTSEVTCWQA
ncbi:UNVERIFIED_ORG: hypothetical protein J2W38_007337 [Variovorax paradoxus]|nr:hypothetical protein [Variovorax paradoxus]